MVVSQVDFKPQSFNCRTKRNYSNLTMLLWCLFPFLISTFHSYQNYKTHMFKEKKNMWFDQALMSVNWLNGYPHLLPHWVFCNAQIFVSRLCQVFRNVVGDAQIYGASEVLLQVGRAQSRQGSDTLPVWMRTCRTSWLGFLNVFPQCWQVFVKPLLSMFFL